MATSWRASAVCRTAPRRRATCESRTNKLSGAADNAHDELRTAVVDLDDSRRDPERLAAASRLLNAAQMIRFLALVSLTACMADTAGDSDDANFDLQAGCKKAVHVLFEPTSGMDALSDGPRCWSYDNMMSGADGWGWCSEINGVMTVKHAPDPTVRWLFDDTNPVRSAALDSKQILACHDAMPNHVAGTEVMARRLDPSTGTTHWQKLIVKNSTGWIVNKWIAELHASGSDVASYFSEWKASPGIGIPQVNAPNVGSTCDSRVHDAVLEVCKAIDKGGTMSIVKNDGRLAFTGGCLTTIVEALNECTKS
jgi:hypothetical protein